MTYQILTNDDEDCIPSLSSILLAVHKSHIFVQKLFTLSKYYDCVMPLQSIEYVGYRERIQMSLFGNFLNHRNKLENQSRYDRGHILLKLDTFVL